MRFLACVAALGLFAAAACSPRHASAGASPSPAGAPQRVTCPRGMPSVAGGLENFGAYIGTWQANHRQVAAAPDEYAIVTIGGHVDVACSGHGFIVAEEFHPVLYVPSGLALRVALTDVPADAVRVYDHTGLRCRTLQYRSQQLAAALGGDDADGHIDIVFLSETSAYNSAAVTVFALGITNRLGQDSASC